MIVVTINKCIQPLELAYDVSLYIGIPLYQLLGWICLKKKRLRFNRLDELNVSQEMWIGVATWEQ